jgi:hypothetical protein
VASTAVAIAAFALVAFPYHATGEGNALRVRWSQKLAEPNPRLTVATSNGRTYVSAGRRLNVFSDSGERLGTFDSPSGSVLSAPTVGGQYVIVSDQVAAYGLDSRLVERWRITWGTSVVRGEFPQMQAASIDSAGTAYLSGVDGKLYAVAQGGRSQWALDLADSAAPDMPYPLAVTDGLVLVASRTAPSHALSLLGIAPASPARRLFELNVGLGVWRLHASGTVGLVVTAYTEAESRRGTTSIVGYDLEGREKWRIDRQRHDSTLAISSSGSVYVASQDVGGTPGTDIEVWRAGRLRNKVAIAGDVLDMALSGDGSAYASQCVNKIGSLVAFSEDLRVIDRLEIGPGCFGPFTLTASGNIFLIHKREGMAPGERGHTEIVSVQTRGRGLPRGGWSMSRANPGGTGSFDRRR